MSASTPTSAQPLAGDGSGLRIVNPATGALLGHVPDMAPAEVAALVRRARAAQPEWEAAGFAARAAVLRRTQKWLIDNQDRVIDTIVAETGKPHDDALMVEIGYAAGALGFWAKHAERFLADEKVRSSSPVLLGRRLVVRHRPLGVIGVIGPWNFPLINCFGDCIPALAAGNAVVLKPSELTPYTSMLMGEGLRESGLPEDVYEVATGAGETGGALIDEVDMVMFTGSTPTGRKVMERAARTLTPVSLELGGKDPMVVLSDADLERAANAAVHGGFQNAGQACLSVERVYVEAPVYDDFVGRVADKVRALRQGVPNGAASVDIGAMSSETQVETVAGHVEEATAGGASPLTGGRRGSGPGYFYEPTVLVGADHSMRILREETFGPALPIVKVADAEEGIRLANDSEYGLSASVWTRDLKRGERLAKRIEAGAVCVNDSQINYFGFELPMGGWKASGLGVRHGAQGIRKFCRQQAIVVTRLAPLPRDPWMMPYSRLKTGLMSRFISLYYGRLRR